MSRFFLRILYCMRNQNGGCDGVDLRRNGHMPHCWLLTVDLFATDAENGGRKYS